MNWKSFIEKDSSKRFVLPPGWASKTEVAEQMGCSEGRVRANLSPAIKEGRVEVSMFPVWNDMTKRVDRVTAYSEVAPPHAAPKRSHHAGPGKISKPE